MASKEYNEERLTRLEKAHLELVESTTRLAELTTVGFSSMKESMNTLTTIVSDLAVRINDLTILVDLLIKKDLGNKNQ